jgi:hypothetical protein
LLAKYYEPIAVFKGDVNYIFKGVFANVLTRYKSYKEIKERKIIHFLNLIYFQTLILVLKYIFVKNEDLLWVDTIIT